MISLSTAKRAVDFARHQGIRIRRDKSGTMEKLGVMGLYIRFLGRRWIFVRHGESFAVLVHELGHHLDRPFRCGFEAERRANAQAVRFLRIYGSKEDVSAYQLAMGIPVTRLTRNSLII